MKFITKYFKWLILAFLVFVIGIIIKCLMEGELTEFDSVIYNFIIGFQCPLLTFLFKFVSFLSSPIVLLILSIVIFVIFPSKKYGFLAICNLIFITLTNQILKIFFSRERPFDLMLVEETGYSFPSGHAMLSTAFYGILIYLIWQTKTSKKIKIFWTIFLSILIVLISVSRIYLGVHYASDIIAGMAISLSYIIIATALINYYLKSKRKNE